MVTNRHTSRKWLLLHAKLEQYLNGSEIKKETSKDVKGFIVISYVLLFNVYSSAKSIGLMTILTISLIFLPTVLSDSLTSVQTTSSSKPFAYAYGQEELSSEEAYLHLVSDIVQQQSNNNSNTTTTTTIQIPETAKGQAIILKKDI